MWGDGTQGRLGTHKANGVIQTEPVLVEALHGVTDIACGQMHSVAVDGIVSPFTCSLCFLI